MKPGKDINEKIAREVMKMVQHSDYKHLWRDASHFTSPFLQLKDYSGSMDAAMEVFEKLSADKREKWNFNCLWKDPNDGQWSFGAFDRDGFWPPDKYDSAPLAICMEALRLIDPKI